MRWREAPVVLAHAPGFEGVAARQLLHERLVEPATLLRLHSNHQPPPEEVGGANLPAVALVGVNEELGYTAVPFTFPPDSPNLHMLLATANPEQRQKYLEPYAQGLTTSAIAISEPGAGGDPAGMKTRAVKDGNDWVINGRKIWISRIAKADFTIVMAVTDQEKGSRGGITAFLVPGIIDPRNGT